MISAAGTWIGGGSAPRYINPQMTQITTDKDLSLHVKNVLGHDFRDAGLLNTALTHRSFSRNHNERLEFLGDALLGMFIADALFAKFPDAAESDLTRLRSSLVNKETLAGLAQQLDLGRHIRFGAGEHKSGGWRKKSLLSNTMEALIGAVYLDSDLESCRRFILAVYASLLDGLTLENIPKDPKSELQEHMQAGRKPLPAYNVIAEEGEAHNKMFTVECCIEDMAEPVVARGRSKRDAEQEAAKAALKMITPDVGQS